MEFNRIGIVTTWNDAAEAINANFDKIGIAIDNVGGGGASSIKTDGTIGIVQEEDKMVLGVISDAIVAEKKGLYTNNNRIGVAIDINEGNRLTLTPAGALRVESENFWADFQ